MKKEAVVIDRAVPGDSILRRKQYKKLERYQRLKDDLEKVWKVHSVAVVPVVIGLGAVSPQSGRVAPTDPRINI